MRINTLLRVLIDELAVDGVPDPLAQPLTLALVWADLARLAGEPFPPVPIRPCQPVPKPRHDHRAAD